MASEPVTKPADEKRPNIVVFLVDDFGQRDLSCYGSAFYQTPQIDLLAAQGMRFTNAYSAYARCVPSRMGLLSGKYPCRIEHAAGQDKSNKHQLPLSEVTFGEALKDQGYQTCYMGKWHLGKKGGGPGQQGFDTVVHSGSAGATGSYFFPFPVEKGNEVENPVKGKDGDYLNDLITDKAVDYVKEDRDKPFLMVLAHYAVHTPFEAPEALTKSYRKKLRKQNIPVGGKRDDEDFVADRQGFTKTLQNNPIYAAMVQSTDQSLGRVVEAIEDAGIEDNTIIILTSDHGGLSTRGLTNRRPVATSNAPFRQGKGSIFEGGTRVPLIVKWPGRVDAGSVSKVQVTGTDFYPTLLEMANADQLPEQHVDGVSFVRALEGQNYQRPPMFWYKWMARPDSTGDTRALALIDGPYKLVRWIDEELVELFNLDDDPGEQVNLASRYPDRTKEMVTQIVKLENEVGNLRARGKQMLDRRLERAAGKANKAKADSKSSAPNRIKPNKIKTPVSSASNLKPGNNQPNILLISIDDLRPELKCYGADHMVTPNIDQLASEGMKFNHAYCQQAVCLPSRISMFTSMRPDSTGVHNLTTHFRKTIPDVVTLTQHLRKSGYQTIGIGKVYHDEQPDEWDQWIDSKTFPGVSDYHQKSVTDDISKRMAIGKQQGLKGKKLRKFAKGPAVEAADAPDASFEDGAITDRVIETLKQSSTKPFFLTVGYHRPHLPFVVPKKYWDMYDRGNIQIPDNYSLPIGSPKIAHSTWGELRAYSDIPKQGPLSNDKALELIHGYYASISFIDAQIGRLLATLTEQGLDQNTVVILVSDHGWKLGEHSMWCKHTNFELDARVPMIIKLPNRPGEKAGRASGRVCDSMVELIDLYPTICDVAGVDVPASCEGASLWTLLNADSPDDVPGRSKAFSQFKRSRKTGGDIVGYSVKVPEGRYTQWTNIESKKIVATEYYDHVKDPQENVNMAASLDPSRKKTLSQLLQSQSTRRHAQSKNTVKKIAH